MRAYDKTEAGKLVKGNSYPGRGIVIGRTPDGAKAVCAYFIMGRSDNSRNRVLVRNGDELCTRPFDETKVENPELIIYTAMRKYEDTFIVSNGDQTDTIWESLEAGGTFEDALKKRSFEPDFPNMTPRISGVIKPAEMDFIYKLSILKSGNAEGTGTVRFVYSYESEPGLGHFIHTYKCDGSPLPAFEGEPLRVDISDDIDRFTGSLWEGLDESNRIALYVRYMDVSTGEYEDRLINRMENKE